MNTDTIAAIATAMSPSGIGIIRISGEEAFSVIDKIYRAKNGKKVLSDQGSHTVHYGFLYDGDEIIDEVMVLIMRAPNTYTREDTIEIDCHGGVLVMKRILETVLKNGARPAEPGEFTKRAFLNGRIDLSQAESVIDIIQSKNDFALKSSIDQLRGALKEKIEKLIVSSENGCILKEGISTVIVGKPNAGKSSLLNVLVGQERAIVTDIAGTTRDILEEQINLNGITLNIVDTAGIRDTDDVVEKIGVDKAKACVDKADLIIYVVDSSTNLDINDMNIIEMLEQRNVIILLNKSDLPKRTTEKEIRNYFSNKIISVSAKDRTGIEELEETVKEMFFQGELKFNDEVFITNIRHKNALLCAKNSLEMVMQSILDKMPEDFYSIDLMSAYEELGGIIGESVDDDLVHEIFSKFCIGK